MTDYIPFFIPVFIIGIFILVTFILSKMGWKQLSDEFRSNDQINGTRIGMQSVRIGWVNYNNCLEIHHNESGFYMRPFFVFKLFHPLIFIPYQNIEIVNSGKSSLNKNCKLKIVGNRTHIITITKRICDEISLHPLMSTRKINYT